MKKKDITVFLMILALVFITAGVIMGQPASVLNKAVQICMECVGIG